MGQTADTHGPMGLFRNRQQEVQLLHGRTRNDLDVFGAELFLKQSMELLEDLLNVIPDRLEQDELRVLIGQVQRHASQCQWQLRFYRLVSSGYKVIDLCWLCPRLL